MTNTATVEIKGGAAVLASARVDGDLLQMWAEDMDVSGKSLQTYRQNIRPFAAWLKAEGIDSPDKHDIRRYREWLKTARNDRTGRPLSASTIYAYMAAVKALTHWMYSAGMTAQDIGADVKNVKIDKGYKKDYLRADEVRALTGSVNRETVTGARDYALIVTMLTTGIRDVEAARANIGDISRSGGRTVLYIQGKGHDDRGDYVALSRAALEAIRAYLAMRADAGEELEDGAPLFAASQHSETGRMRADSISRTVKRRLRAAGIDDQRVTAHSLRHTAATQNLLSGGTVAETQQLLRHASYSTTMCYAHILDRERNRSEERIARALGLE